MGFAARIIEEDIRDYLIIQLAALVPAIATPIKIGHYAKEDEPETIQIRREGNARPEYYMIPFDPARIIIITRGVEEDTKTPYDVANKIMDILQYTFETPGTMTGAEITTITLLQAPTPSIDGDSEFPVWTMIFMIEYRKDVT